jgi:signal transduction histidine kinase
MDESRVWERSPLLIVTLGLALFSIAVVHHVSELLSLDEVLGPMIALMLDGIPALGIAYGGYRFSQIESTPDHRRQAVVWALGGGLIFLAVMWSTFLVRIIEGRAIAEPLFPLLVAVEAGIIAGLIAGHHSGQAQAEARHAQTVTDALTFVNSLIRHDLRNDLAVIKGHSEHIETQQPATDDEPKRDPSVVITEKSNEALTRIRTTHAITDILVGDSDFEPVDLAEITGELATRIDATYNGTVTTNLPEHALVSANEGLRSVVDNLLENALQHNDTDDSRVKISVKTDATTVRLTVSDNGPGIPETQKQSLFDANTTGVEGSGLTLVQTLIDGYNGSIRVEDNEPQGTTFVVELPRANKQP